PPVRSRLRVRREVVERVPLDLARRRRRWRLLRRFGRGGGGPFARRRLRRAGALLGRRAPRGGVACAAGVADIGHVGDPLRRLRRAGLGARRVLVVGPAVGYAFVVRDRWLAVEPGPTVHLG